MNKIIFLDIDGVLNHDIFLSERTEKKNGVITFKEKYDNKEDWDRSQIDPASVEFLNQLIDSTGAKVVISSTWRLTHTPQEMQELLNSLGFKGEIVGRTPSLGTKRGVEVEAYVTTLAPEEITDYVIIDDDSDMLDHQLAHHFVWVDRYCGISPTTVYKAARILNGESNGQFRGHF